MQELFPPPLYFKFASQFSLRRTSLHSQIDPSPRQRSSSVIVSRMFPKAQHVTTIPRSVRTSSSIGAFLIALVAWVWSPLFFVFVVLHGLNLLLCLFITFITSTIPKSVHFRHNLKDKTIVYAQDNDYECYLNRVIGELCYFLELKVPLHVVRMFREKSVTSWPN